MQDEPVDQKPDFVGVEEETSNLPDTIGIKPLSDNIARLETSLDTEREERLEERFRWICVTSLLLDVIAVAALDGSWLFIPIFMLQLIALIGFAKAYGVDWAEQLIGQLLHWVSQQNKNDD